MTPDGLTEFRIQLKDAVTGKAIITAGGTVYVAANGGAAKQAIKDSTGASMSNPMTPTRGFINFFTANTVSKVDLYIMAPGGQFLVAKNVEASGPNELLVDTGNPMQCMVIPFAQADFADNAETDSGFDCPGSALMLPAPFVRITKADATETINVGTDSGDSGDADGFIASVSIGSTGVAKATIANGANTLGALFEVQDSANSGDLTHEGHVSAGKSITYTTSSGADSGEGFIHLPYVLAA